MKAKIVFSAILVLLFIGCGESPKPLYYWDGAYTNAVHRYLLDEQDVDQQIASLEQSISMAHQKNYQVPPGLYAHLGLLYSNIGNFDQARFYFDKETANFPESKAYIDFLLSQNKSKKVEK